MNMSTTGRVIHRFDSLAYVATDPMPRDREPSHRLHEPAQMVITTDPITGRELDDIENRPYIVDGNMTIYFESEQSRQAYLDMPIDHPVPLPDNPVGEGVAEG